jgi:DNA repair exonuclease SbcCD ATPase subunit
MDKAAEDSKTREGQEGALEALDKEINETASSENKKEYEEIKNQYNEFKESGNVFSNLIKCVLGASNV